MLNLEVAPCLIRGELVTGVGELHRHVGQDGGLDGGGSVGAAAGHGVMGEQPEGVDRVSSEPYIRDVDHSEPLANLIALLSTNLDCGESAAISAGVTSRNGDSQRRLGPRSR